MSHISATGASTGPQRDHEREPAWGMGRWRLAEAGPTRLRFAGKRPARAPLLAAPLLLAIAALPWLTTHPTSRSRVVSGLLVALACGLIAWGRPRRPEVVVDVENRRLRSGGTSVAIPETASWSLELIAPGLTFPEGGYEARLGPVAGRDWPLLRDRDPARVLAALGRIDRCWQRPVRSGWGLAEGARPWQISAASPDDSPAAGGREPAETLVESRMASPGLRYLMIALTALIALDLVVLVASESQVVVHVHFVSLILPCLMAAYLIALTLGLVSHRDRLRLGRDLLLETTAFGLTRRRGRLPASSVRGLHVVGNPLANERHLLVDSARGPLAIAVPSRAADSLAERLRQALAERARIADHAPAPFP
jgi:hypothetical protein